MKWYFKTNFPKVKNPLLDKISKPPQKCLGKTTLESREVKEFDRANES
jgi:hypothetical protein